MLSAAVRDVICDSLYKELQGLAQESDRFLTGDILFAAAAVRVLSVHIGISKMVVHAGAADGPCDCKRSG